ncbi:MAG TPA: glycosyltransferase family A protein [Parvibaculum sp.]|jgi:glycosyltransferase involved in cell wall biosynthesis
MKTVSVIMTCHNEEAFIEQAVRSVAVQTAQESIREIIVVDDGSTDGSGAVLARLGGEIGKLRVMEANGIGPSAARNLAIRLASGCFIAFLDGDDYWVREKLERQLPAFDLDDRIGLVYGDYADFARDDASDAQAIGVRRLRSASRDTLGAYFVHDGPVVPSTMIVRRAALDEAGLFDESLHLGEDMDLCLRLAEGWKFEHVSGVLAFKRRHGSNLTRRLDVFLPVAAALTEKFVARNPRLASLAGRRMARRYAKTGNDCVSQGERWKGLVMLLIAVRRDPFFWRPYVYLALALVPRGLDGLIRRRAKAFFHRRTPSMKPISSRLSGS